MSSQARIRANRRNAKRSTGPRTQSGKEASKYNALKHGLSAKALILPWEEPAEFHQIRGTLFSYYNPENPIEAFLVDQVSQHWWRINRSRQFETRMMSKFESADPKCHPAPEEMENFRRYDTGTDRAFYRSLDHLEKMIRRRPAPEEQQGDEAPYEPVQERQMIAEETVNPNGFVSQKTVEPFDDAVPALLSEG